jgi:glycosyltransferase involved in cell wall biosynthesis
MSNLVSSQNQALNTPGDREQPRRAESVRILHIAATLNRGGVETWLSQVLIRLPRDRYQCDVCTYRLPGGTYAGDLQKYGCKIYFVPLRFTPSGLFQFGQALKRLLRTGHYQIVHCHGLLLVGFILFISWTAKIPVRIGHSHNTDRLTLGRFAAIATSVWLRLNQLLSRMFSTRGVGCSEEAQEALFGRWRSAKSKYSIVHCGIDLARFEAPADRLAVREALGLPPDAEVIGHVSNLGVAKNPRFVVEIADYVFQRRESAWLLIVGDGVLRPELERICAARGISSRAIFAGVRPNVPELMRCAMDVFVMPSVHEGLPLVLLEAQAAGLPCVVSDVVSPESQISSNSIRFLSLTDGAAIWGEQVLCEFNRSGGNPAALQTMKETDFNIVVSARRLADLYDETAA